MILLLSTLVFIGAAGLMASLLQTRPRLPRRARTDAVDRTSPSDHDAIAAFEWAAGEIRSGGHTTAAVHQALRRHPGVLTEVRRSLDRGGSLSDAVDVESAVSGDDRWFAHNLRLCEASSSSSAEVLERAVAIARERRAWSGERRALAAQARLSARLLTLVPAAFAVWGVASSPSVRAAYRVTPLTAACTAAGIALNVIGWWWMNRLVGGSTDVEEHSRRRSRRVGAA